MSRPKRLPNKQRRVDIASPIKSESGQSSDSTKIPLKEQESLNEVLQRLAINNWDFVCFGDASGSNWERECAWAAVSIERATMERLEWWGFVNRGSVNFAEIKAYEAPLTWIANREADQKNRRRAVYVHIITDSEYAKNTGNLKHSFVKKNAILWDNFSALSRQGIIVKWHWAGREDVALNSYVDAASKLVRKLFSVYNIPERLGTNAAGRVVQSVYDINPDA